MFDFYKAKWYLQTVSRAKKEGIDIGRSWGYVVRIDPIPSYLRQGVYSWCATKSIAQDAIRRYEKGQKEGTWGCPCGSDKQARYCCGM